MLSINFFYAQKRARYMQNSALMAEGNPKSSKHLTKQLSDSDTSEEEQVHPMLKTLEEERHYGTIPGSALATPSCKVRIKKLTNDEVKDKSTQTSKEIKQTK